MNIFCNVQYKNGNTSLCLSEIEVNISDFVIVKNDKGEHYGKVVAVLKEIHDDDSNVIVRIATQDDSDTYLKNLRDEKEAYEKAKEFVKELKLNMHIVSTYLNFNRTQLLINFTSDERIDFRELAKKMAYIYKTRIELRQIGARDRAKIEGGIGICGNQLCCKGFLKQIDSISMNKAKNQNLALNPSKINGACGRLLCCLCYEDEEYTRCSKGLFPVGTEIKIDGEKGTIIGIDVLTRTYKVLVKDEKIKVKHEDLGNDSKK